MHKKLPCIICGELNVEAHHAHYDLPLDVIWLCTKHHKQTHREDNKNKIIFSLIAQSKL